MDWRTKVELFEEIRREYEFGIGTIVGVAEKLGVHRRMVREAIASALPEKRRKAKERPGKLKMYYERIDRMLEQDRTAPRKQRHTARRIWDRLKEEVEGFEISERSVRGYVSRRREELGICRRETFVPQAYELGAEGQVDFYEAWAELGGERVRLQVFSMRSMSSGGAFHRAYFRATQQAFLEAHELAFRYFGGVLHRLRYDNLLGAVKKVVRGFRREETTKFIAFRSHWRLQRVLYAGRSTRERRDRRRSGLLSPQSLGAAAQSKRPRRTKRTAAEFCRRDQQRQIPGKELPVGVGMGQNGTRTSPPVCQPRLA